MSPGLLRSAVGAELALQSAGQLGYLVAELEAIERIVSDAPLWLPSQPLARQIHWVRQELTRIEATWASKLVVAIAGPSGAGKSTLLNALANAELSPTGLNRPTTREIVVYCQSEVDLGHLLDDWPAEHLRIHSDPLARGLDHLILVDTPDTNTLPENQAILAQVLDSADLILAVLSAANPKLQDNIAYLQPYVQRVGPSAVVPILNAVDRITADQLRMDVLPDATRHLSKVWGLESPRVYAISARAHTPSGTIHDDELPLHRIDEFSALQALLREQLDSAHQVVDRRLARGEHLLRLLRTQVASALAETAPQRIEAQNALQQLSNTLADEATAQVRADRASLTQARRLVTVGMAANWWGPVGWLVAIWGAIVRWTHQDARRGEIAGIGGAAWVSRLERITARLWPPVADSLVAAGIQSSVRQAAFMRQQSERQAEMIESRTTQAWRSEVARLVRHLSAWPLQLLLNAAPIGMLGWIGVASVRAFVTESVLPTGYYQNGGIATLTVWLAGLILLQIITSLACSWMLPRRIGRALRTDLQGVPLATLRQQIETLADLERRLSEVDRVR